MIGSRRTSFLKLIDFEAEVPSLIEATLAAFDHDYRQISSLREDPISRQVVFALLRLQTDEEWAWLSDYAINSQRDELDPELETHEGRTDITFELGGHGRFIWECKRLHHDGKTLYSEYCSEGVMRFVSARYAKDQRLGGMLAFVMDGDVPRAVGGVEKHLNGHAHDLLLRGKCLQACPHPLDHRLRVTVHLREQDFTLYHCFLSLHESQSGAS